MSTQRRNSLTNSAKKVYIDNNPLSGGSLSDVATIHVENIANAKPISSEDLEDIILEGIRFTDDNEERLDILEDLKEPYLFTSSDLIKIVEVTPSLKTRITMIQMIGPRLSDPNAQVSTFTDMFRFTEQKQAVEDVLKARMNAINASKFTTRTGGNTLLRGGPGGRGGRGGAPALGGRGMASGRGRPVSTSVVVDLNRKLSSNSLSPKVSSKKSPGKTTEDLSLKPDRKNPEICPEDSSSGPSSPANSFVSPAKPVVDHIITTPLATKVSFSTEGEITKVTAVHSKDTVSDSPNTDSETSTLVSCATPTELHSAAVRSELAAAEAAVHVRPALSPVPEVATTSTATAASIATPVPTPTTSSTSAALVEESGTRSAFSPIPGATATTNSTGAAAVPFVITARAIQKAPSAPTSRRGSALNQNNQSSSTATPVLTPNLTPVASSTNLASMGSQQSSAAPSPMSTHSAHSTHSNASPVPTAPHVHSGGGLSTSIAAYKDFDLAPMVADCRPEKGVSSLKSMFSGGATSTKSLPPKPPLEYTPAKLRPENAGPFAFKPATSTANSLRSYRVADTSSAGAMDARSNAPAPIVIPGATLSLAEMRAKFSRNSIAITTSPGGLLLDTSNSASSQRGGVHSEASSPSAPRVLIRRHSECALGSINPNNSSMLAALAAANASFNISPVSSSSASSPSNASAETAGAGADLASRCAAALNLTRAEFVMLEREDALFAPENSIDDSNSPKSPSVPQYSYREVVRRNFVKVYEELNQNELEKHVCDGDFFAVFGRSKDEYAKQPRWRQVEQKKKALLF